MAELPLQNLLHIAVHTPVFQEHLLVMTPFILVEESQSRLGRKVSFWNWKKNSFSNGFVGFLLSRTMLLIWKPVQISADLLNFKSLPYFSSFSGCMVIYTYWKFILFLKRYFKLGLYLISYAIGRNLSK